MIDKVKRKTHHPGLRTNTLDQVTLCFFLPHSAVAQKGLLKLNEWWQKIRSLLNALHGGKINKSHNLLISKIGLLLHRSVSAVFVNWGDTYSIVPCSLDGSRSRAQSTNSYDSNPHWTGQICRLQIWQMTRSSHGEISDLPKKEKTLCGWQFTSLTISSYIAS